MKYVTTFPAITAGVMIVLAFAVIGADPAYAQAYPPNMPPMGPPGNMLETSFHYPQSQAPTPQMYVSDNQTLITVSGTATAALDSDQVTLSLGVYTINKTVSAALDENNAKTQNVINALESAGVTPSEIRTSYFNINPIYQNSPGTYGPGNLTGYSVTDSIMVTSSNIGSVSTWIDTAVKNGADSVYFYFAISNSKVQSSLPNLTQQAIGDAKTKAEQAASDMGMKVIALKSMSVYNGGFYYGPLAAASGGGVAGPIMPGQQQVSVSVNAVYVIG